MGGWSFQTLTAMHIIIVHISFSSHARVTVVAAQIVCGVQFIDFGFFQPRVALAFSGALNCHLDFYNARSCSRLSVALRSNQLLLNLSAWPIEQVQVQITAAQKTNAEPMTSIKR